MRKYLFELCAYIMYKKYKFVYSEYLHSNFCNSKSVSRHTSCTGTLRRLGRTFWCFLTGFVLIFLFMCIYLPLYREANFSRMGTVVGWSPEVSRDIKIYIQPGKTTFIHGAKNVCSQRDLKTQMSSNENESITLTDDDQLYLLIVVCSCSGNFEARTIIRETWANYTNYLLIKHTFDEIRDKYIELSLFKVKRILRMLIHSMTGANSLRTNDKREIDEIENTSQRYRVVFLLGLPNAENDLDVQSKLDEEADKYGDIIQEDFIDTYNNLTIKSGMMLKWVVERCNQRVQYILKTDDDMFVNVVNLERALDRARSSWKAGPEAGLHQMLGGYLFCGARPIFDLNDKWYSSRYIYNESEYPCYLSGTGYVLSGATAHALYEAALQTRLFHMEDIFITGMCAALAKPPVKPSHIVGFEYADTKGGQDACALYTRVTAHRLPAEDMRRLMHEYTSTMLVDRCEKLRNRW